MSKAAHLEAKTHDQWAEITVRARELIARKAMSGGFVDVVDFRGEITTAAVMAAVQAYAEKEREGYSTP